MCRMKNDLYLLIIFLLLLAIKETEGTTTHSVTGCSPRVNLSCPISEMIHVERITYYNGTDCNQALTDQQVCGQPLTGSDTGLLPVCNGKKSCDEILYYTCPGSKEAKVDYRCIQGKKDMCDEVTINNTNSIFLSTPNYPSSPTFKSVSSCRCHIRGSNITSIEILELILTSAHVGTKSSIEISYGDVKFTTESLNSTRRLVYNDRFTSTATTAKIILNHNHINNQYLWIEIQGVSMLLTCNNAALTTHTPSKSTPSMPTASNQTKTTSTPTITTTTEAITMPWSANLSSGSDSSSFVTQSNPGPMTSTTSKRSKGDDNTAVLAGSVAGGVVLIVLIIIIIIFICRKRSNSPYDKPVTNRQQDDPNYLPLHYQDMTKMTTSSGKVNDGLMTSVGVDLDKTTNTKPETDNIAENRDNTNTEGEIQYAQIDTQATYGHVGKKNSGITDDHSTSPHQESLDTNQARSSVYGPVYTEVKKPKKPNQIPDRIVDENEFYVSLEETMKNGNL